jgi:hypothetical protein
MRIWPFLSWVALALTLAFMSAALSGGLPWGVDDGVKRLMARGLFSSDDRSLNLEISTPSNPQGQYFPLPPPFATVSQDRATGIFPALYPALGGLLFSFLGPLGFSVLTSLSFTLWLYACRRIFRLTAGAMLILGGSLIFYGLTFWEHGLALLCLLPLFHTLAFKKIEARSWFWAGMALAAGSYLRPEAGFLFPLVLIVLAVTKYPRRGPLMALYSAGLALGLTVTLLFERTLNGRWIPPQWGTNLHLAWTHATILEKVEGIITSLFDAPLPGPTFAVILLLLTVVALMLKRPLWLVIGAGLLSIIGLLHGWLTGSAFALTVKSQGLIFAWPWVCLGLPITLKRKWMDQPLWLAGGGFILLVLLSGASRPGIHWGPRFMLPALLPVLICCSDVLTGVTQRQRRLIMAITALAVILNGGAAVTAIAERGAAGRKVVNEIRAGDFQTLILDRWHAGADLEPLWGEMNLMWAENQGDLEEVLISLRGVDFGRLGWLNQKPGWPWQDLPLAVTRLGFLPGKGGWKGEVLSVVLSGEDDHRWGLLYWHSGRRSAERGDFSGALERMREAVRYLPDEADLHYDLALTLGRLERVQESLDELRETLKINPNHAQALGLWRRLVPG